MIIANELAEKMFGMTQEQAWERRVCIRCKAPAVFANEVGKLQYRTSALCGKCFNEMVGGVE